MKQPLWGFGAVLSILMEIKSSTTPGLYFSALIKPWTVVDMALHNAFFSMTFLSIRRREDMFSVWEDMHLRDHKTHLVISLYVPLCALITI